MGAQEQTQEKERNNDAPPSDGKKKQVKTVPPYVKSKHCCFWREHVWFGPIFESHWRGLHDERLKYITTLHYETLCMCLYLYSGGWNGRRCRGSMLSAATGCS